MSKPEFIDVFGTRCAILPVTEENVIAAAGIMFNRHVGAAIKIGAVAKVYVVSRADLESTQSIDDQSLVALHFEVSYGSYPLRKADLFISKRPNMPWEDLQKLIIVIPEPKAAPALVLPPGNA